MFCTECGKELPGDSEFCAYCGKALTARTTDEGQAGQPPAPPPGPTAPVPPSQLGGVATPATPAGPAAVPPVQTGPRAGPPGKSPLPWILGGVGVAVVIAVALVLVFVVFGGGADTSGAEKVVETFWEAMEKQDVDMLLSTMEPSYRSELEDALGKEYKKIFEDYFFIAFPEDMEITIRKMDTEIDGDKAVVTVVDGTMTYTDEFGDEVTEEASEAEDIETTDLVKVGGKWYISSDMWVEAGLDPSEFKDLTDKEEDGETTTEESGKTPTAEELGVPVYPGSEVDEYLSIDEIGEEELGIAGTAYSTEDPVDKVIAWYRNELSGEPNFEEDPMFDEDGETGLFFFGTIDEMKVVYVSKEGSQTLIMISLMEI